jgi:hypothetical protein
MRKVLSEVSPTRFGGYLFAIQTNSYELFFLSCFFFFFFFGWLKISIWFEYVNQKNKLEEDLEEVTNKVFFDFKIGTKRRVWPLWICV